jgi:hypothetical protein
VVQLFVKHIYRFGDRVYAMDVYKVALKYKHLLSCVHCLNLIVFITSSKHVDPPLAELTAGPKVPAAVELHLYFNPSILVNQELFYCFVHQCKLGFSAKTVDGRRYTLLKTTLFGFKHYTAHVLSLRVHVCSAVQLRPATIPLEARTCFD